MNEKMISHERAKRSVQNLYDPSNNSEKYCVELVDYILQQEKVTQLLRLYERLSYYSKYDVFDKETRERVFEIKDGILELKKELGEVK